MSNFQRYSNINVTCIFQTNSTTKDDNMNGITNPNPTLRFIDHTNFTTPDTRRPMNNGLKNRTTPVLVTNMWWRHLVLSMPYHPPSGPSWMRCPGCTLYTGVSGGMTRLVMPRICTARMGTGGERNQSVYSEVRYIMLQS